MNPRHRIQDHLAFLYQPEEAEWAWEALEARLESFQNNSAEVAVSRQPDERLSQEDAVLITYGDQISEPGVPPLRTLAAFLRRRLAGTISSVHLLPFYPYTSDDGFSVVDYWQVNPDLGDWGDVALIGKDFRLMFDAVVNHISRSSRWFEAFLQGQAPYTNYFIAVPPETDLSMVVRPRALPLLSPVETADRGTVHVWTTFSDDQIDLNFGEPRVLVEIAGLLLDYVAHGAEIIRLDAIAYLWKRPGTSSIHLPETHRVVKLFRAMLDEVAPGVILITETNVPHEENISYFGKRLPETGSTDEAQMVYQFPLAPLVLHTFLEGEARALSDWAAGLAPPSAHNVFFNFIASHDGIGVRPAEGLLSPVEVQALVGRTLAHGGQASYKTNQDGSRSVYELNITLYDFLNDPNAPLPERDLARFMASQAIMLSLAGVPGIYIHSLFGSRNCLPCLNETGRARSINREKFALPELEAQLSDQNTRARRVFDAYRSMLAVRKELPAFHPAAGQRVLSLAPTVFGLVRGNHGGDDQVLCLVEVSGAPVELEIDLAAAGMRPVGSYRDLFAGGQVASQEGRLPVSLQAYQVRWLLPVAEE